MRSPYRLPDELETNRFLLRRVNVANAKSIFDSYAADPEVARFLSWKPHRSEHETAAFLEVAVSEWDQGKGFPVVASRREQPAELIGMFHPRLNGHCVRYGYVLRASVWGKGTATEVMTWLVDHALSHPAIFRAEAFCDVDHAASARVMEKAGMRREGILRRYLRHPNIADAPRDCTIYSKVR
jgi:[ribosomal protein S5]-alanine N-acetyltransferase